MIGTDLHGVPDGITFAVVGVRADVRVKWSGRANRVGEAEVATRTGGVAKRDRRLVDRDLDVIGLIRRTTSGNLPALAIDVTTVAIPHERDKP